MGDNADATYAYFAGVDAERITDLNTALRDDSVAATILTPSVLADATDNCTQDLTIDRDDCTPDFSNGWFVRMIEGRGEKVLSAALTAANRVYFTSYLPPRSNDASSCGPSEGGGLYYAMTLKKATAVFNFESTDCPATGVAGTW